MGSDVRDKISNAATVIEITLGLIILIACVVSSLALFSQRTFNCCFPCRITYRPA